MNGSPLSSQLRPSQSLPSWARDFSACLSPLPAAGPGKRPYRPHAPGADSSWAQQNRLQANAPLPRSPAQPLARCPPSP